MPAAARQLVRFTDAKELHDCHHAQADAEDILIHPVVYSMSI
jgi:hypothetical protein